MPFLNRQSDPVAAMRREVEGLRLQDREKVTESYKNELAKAEETRRQAQAERVQHLSEAINQENQYVCNTRLVENALKDINNGKVLAIKAIKDSNNPQTWELFCKSLPLHKAIKKGKLRVVQVLLNSKDPRFYIDYTFRSNSFDDPDYMLALSLRGNISTDEQGIYDVMFQRILKDIPQFSKSGQLRWFLHAITIAPELINSPIPERHGFTPAMQLAKDNHTAALMTIDADLSEDSDYSIDFTKSDVFGKTIFNYAFEHGHKELSLWLLEKSKLTLSPIEKACINGNVTEVEKLLAIHNGSVNYGINENAPLLWAVMHNYNEIVAKLIASNKVNIKANDNIAVITAVRYGYLKIAKQLTDAGADISAQNYLALAFAKALSTETRELRDKKRDILDFIFNAKINAPKSITEKTTAAINIQYLWKNYKLVKKQQTSRQHIETEQAIAQVNIAREGQRLKEHLEVDPTRILHKFLASRSMEDARRLSNEQRIQLASTINVSTIDSEIFGVLCNVDNNTQNILCKRLGFC